MPTRANHMNGYKSIQPNGKRSIGIQTIQIDTTSKLPNAEQSQTNSQNSTVDARILARATPKIPITRVNQGTMTSSNISICE